MARDHLIDTPDSGGGSILDGISLYPQITPVCRLSDGALVATTLEVHGPPGTSLASATALRRAARMMAQEPILDARRSRFLASDPVRGLAARVPLFVGLDIGLYRSGWAPLESTTARASHQVMTITPQALADQPREVLRVVDAAREQGTTICLNPVTATTASLTALILLEPDVVLLGPDLLRRPIGPDAARLAHAVWAHTERCDALVVATGVDDEQHLVPAQTLGAAVGMGGLYPSVTDPTELDRYPTAALPELPVRTTPPPQQATPFAIVEAAIVARPATKRLLVAMSKEIERQAHATHAAVVLGTFQFERNFSSSTARRWQAMSETVGLVGVYGVGVTAIRDGNVHRAPLDPDDDLVEEWTVAVLGPHFAAVLSARDRHEDAPELDRRFDFVQSYDRTVVTQCVHSILSRFV
ncbi:DICT sensory domain-containing protein [Gordonia sp. NPDC003425]